MPFQLDYRHIAPRQATGTAVNPPTLTGTTVVEVFPTTTGLSGVAGALAGAEVRRSITQFENECG